MATILVIDDDLDLQQMLRLMLQRGGHKVITTGDGPDGLSKAKAIKPDMSIVDVMMPGMNGYQVVRKMREDPELAKMAILILTARAQPVDREAAIAAQADDYMPKPFAPNELLAKVNELLVNRSASQGPAKRTVTLLVAARRRRRHIDCGESGAGFASQEFVHLPGRSQARPGTRGAAIAAQCQDHVDRLVQWQRHDGGQRAANIAAARIGPGGTGRPDRADEFSDARTGHNVVGRAARKIRARGHRRAQPVDGHHGRLGHRLGRRVGRYFAGSRLAAIDRRRCCAP